jgi:hypothetical protein
MKRMRSSHFESDQSSNIFEIKQLNLNHLQNKQKIKI